MTALLPFSMVLRRVNLWRQKRSLTRSLAVVASAALTLSATGLRAQSMDGQFDRSAYRPAVLSIAFNEDPGAGSAEASRRRVARA